MFVKEIFIYAYWYKQVVDLHSKIIKYYMNIRTVPMHQPALFLFVWYEDAVLSCYRQCYSLLCCSWCKECCTILNNETIVIFPKSGNLKPRVLYLLPLCIERFKSLDDVSNSNSKEGFICSGAVREPREEYYDDRVWLHC